jgi:Xaa-Pro aminopeptidase
MGGSQLQEGLEAMPKQKSPPVKSTAVVRAETQLTAIRKAATLAGRAMARLEADASAALAERNGKAASTFQMVASAGEVTALIRAKGMVIEVNNGDFAVSLANEKDSEG